MSYIGSSAAPIPVAFSGVLTQSFNGTGSASLFTLSRQVTVVTDIEVIVNNVQQSPFDGSYSIVNNGLGLQFSENPSAGTNNIYVVYRDQPLGSLRDTGAVRLTGDQEIAGVKTFSSNTGFGTTNPLDVVHVAKAGGSGAGGRVRIQNSGVRQWSIGTVDANFTIKDETGATDPFKVDAGGRITMPYQPAFDAYKSAGSVSAGAVIPFNNIRTNRGGHFNTSTYRFTAPVAGAYFVYLHCGVNITSGATWYGIRVNGTRVLDAEFAGSGWFNPFLAGTLTLSVGDYVDALMIGAPSSTDSSTWTGFGGYLLG